jgi:hypothetical protein
VLRQFLAMAKFASENKIPSEESSKYIKDFKKGVKEERRIFLQHIGDEDTQL